MKKPKPELGTVIRNRIVKRMETMRNNIRDLRKQENVTQKEMARYCNLTQTQISAIETGRSAMMIEELLYYCERFSKTPNELLGYDTDEETVIRDVVQRLVSLPQSTADKIISNVEYINEKRNG